MQDAMIVELYWQRSEQAIEETERKYGRYCRSIAYRICSDREDTEECVNDTWLGAWNAMPDKRPTALAAFLGRITRNCALDKVLARGRAKRGGGEVTLALEELAECAASVADPAQELELRELERVIDAFVGALPVEERTLFVARYWFLAPVNELAERFGYSRSKVKSTLHRTRGKLRSYLQKEGWL